MVFFLHGIKEDWAPKGLTYFINEDWINWGVWTSKDPKDLPDISQMRGVVKRIDSSEPAGSEPEPLPYIPFPIDCLPQTMRDFVIDTTRVIGLKDTATVPKNRRLKTLGIRFQNRIEHNDYGSVTGATTD